MAIIECPKCGDSNAYCDGVQYVCPDCGYVWPCPEIDKAESEEEDDA